MCDLHDDDDDNRGNNSEIVENKDKTTTTTTTTTTTNTTTTDLENKEKEEREYLEYLKYRDEIIDSHCHIHEDIEHQIESCKLPFKKILLMGTTVEDWERLNSLADKINDENKVIRCFGIHPWFAYQYNPPIELIGKEKIIEPTKTTTTTNTTTNTNKNEIITINETWYQLMKEQLLKYPNSIVGEIGIDKVTKVRMNGYNKNDQDGQMIVFKKQINIANELNRLVSLHCVQLHGKLLDYFQTTLTLDKFPPKIALHTFGGKPATVTQFSKMSGGKGDRFYFGLSFINLSSSKVDRLIQSIPDDKLLLESDQNTPLESESSLFKLIQRVSNAKNWSIQKTIIQTSLNTINFLKK